MRNWLEGLSRKSIGPDFQEGLKNGIILCDALNAIQPGTVRKVNQGNMPFKCMENLQNFLAGCRVVGVLDSDLFAVPDLYEGKNMTLVLQALNSLATVAHGRGGVKFVPPGPSTASVNMNDPQSQSSSYSGSSSGGYSGSSSGGYSSGTSQPKYGSGATYSSSSSSYSSSPKRYGSGAGSGSSPKTTPKYGAGSTPKAGNGYVPNYSAGTSTSSGKSNTGAYGAKYGGGASGFQKYSSGDSTSSVTSGQGQKSTGLYGAKYA
mmetsp:Transcript_29935/g.46346  ORF Transcript_29935/g.46346 Transcript_29935/m.46346 type:complete len:262 (-) Transcript_29935:91-876(-)